MRQRKQAPSLALNLIQTADLQMKTTDLLNNVVLIQTLSPLFMNLFPAILQRQLKPRTLSLMPEWIRISPCKSVDKFLKPLSITSYIPQAKAQALSDYSETVEPQLPHKQLQALNEIPGAGLVRLQLISPPAANRCPLPASFSHTEVPGDLLHNTL